MRRRIISARVTVHSNSFKGIIFFDVRRPEKTVIFLHYSGEAIAFFDSINTLPVIPANLIQRAFSMRFRLFAKPALSFGSLSLSKCSGQNDVVLIIL